ncbi:uncharacterized protein EV420DRAFT_140598 [Desarmillaria tabescens]|uniref:Calcium activated cation channel n=1 Tax=Armillaria tabescens TaxID=1929756 RepID=A0AA39NAD8_ARMTA|nr:uncharacterized protein EV420DRAFT_140598 [Desarmillaria tabescens]KAK0462001.1 hypothetical protein EV420DRAFT_140598 [Desarmillaria tabescens]
MNNDSEATPLLSVKYVPSPDTLTKLVKRLRALTLTLLPVEVSPTSLSEPTSRIITPQVIAAYRESAGDFVEALPYCLLRARAEFMYDADHNPADYGENYGRAIACEVLARKIVHQSPPDRVNAFMSTRFKHRQLDGDESDMASALEMAIDSHCTIFLSSTEAQDVVGALWRGDLIQKNNENLEIEYVPYSETHLETFWGHLDPSRLSVPRYQNIVRVIVWFVLLFVYCQTVRQPAERLDPLNNAHLDGWEDAFYLLALSITLEDVYKVRVVILTQPRGGCLMITQFTKLLTFVTWRVFTFWNMVSLITDSLILAAFILRVVAMRVTSDEEQIRLRIASFQVLSFVSPFIWMKLLTVFDGYKYIGTMQICIARMLQESGIFFALLSVMALGFTQALWALDAADGQASPPSSVVNVLVQALLGSPNFDIFSRYQIMSVMFFVSWLTYCCSSSGLVMYYFWNVVTAIILLNVLISLFASAYQNIVDDAEAQYLAFFAGKTVGMIRAPDVYVYPAPFNLIEILFVTPFEHIPGVRLNDKNYAKLNRAVMRVVFIIPLTLIALYESTHGRHWVTDWLRSDNEGDENYSQSKDPEADAEEDGRRISKIPFEELIKAFPNTAQSSEELLLNEINGLKKQLNAVLQKLDGGGASVKGE